MFELCQVVPFLLYCKFAPNGAPITIVPVGTAQVGWVITVAVGAAGIGCKLIVCWFEVAGLPDTPLRSEVITTSTTSPFEGI